MTKPTNILIIMADQLTPFALGCHGGPALTPNIDALADRGAHFDAAYCNSPLCTPARYAFMTGQYVSRCGGYDNAAYMPSTMPTFAHYLRAMGYRTALSGKMHFVGPDQLHGFEERYTTDVYPADFGWVPDWTQPDERIDLWYHNMSSVKQAGVASITNQLAYDDEVGAQAERAIHDFARADDGRPFCLVTSFIHPHDPYAARRRFWELYDDVEIPAPRVARPSPDDNDPHSLRLEKVIALDAVDLTEAEILNARRAYYANVSYVDEWVGRLRATLADAGLADTTAIVLTADHGDMLGERGLWYKMSLREPSVRVPLIVYWPGETRARRISNAVSLVDILPTLTAMASAATGRDEPEAVDPLDGRSLLSLATGGDGADLVVAEYLAEGTGQPMLMIREGAWKYVCCPGDPEQLFDLAEDPDELSNLARSPRFEELAAGFRQRARDHWVAEEIRAKVLDDQRRRRLLSDALSHGVKAHWDYQPCRDAANEYTRSHMDLTAHDAKSRWPRPRLFQPRWR